MSSEFQFLTHDVGWFSLVSAAVVLCFSICVYTQCFGLPRGPVGVPYLGYYPYLADNLHPQLTEMVKTYGDVFSLRVTGQLYVHLGSLKAVREAHVTKSDCFTQKPMVYCTTQELFHDGLILSNGEQWKVLRKFFIQSLKEFVMGKNVQEVITDQAQKVVDVLKKSNDEIVDLTEIFSHSCTMVIRRLLFKEVNISDEDCTALRTAYVNMLDLVIGPEALLAGPLAEYYFIPRTKGFKAAIEGKALMERIFYKIIQQHEDSFDKDNLRNLVDSYIYERKTLRQKGDPKSFIFTDSALVGTLIQFFGDGGLSVGLVISDTIKELLKHPEVLQKMQSEIDEVVGRDRQPNWGDQNLLQYTSAALYEVQRTTNSFPIIPSLECTKETTIQGRRIPRGTITLINIWAVHRDAELYEEPDKFDPSRYMSTADRKSKVELPILFGVGKRTCIGESLTRMQLLLFLTTVLQNFDLHPVQKDASSGLNGEGVFEVLARVITRAP